MSSGSAALPLALSVLPEPRPDNAAELYLDTIKKILTRALTATGTERHTIRPNGPRSSFLARVNKALAGVGLEVVRLTKSTTVDYIESCHEFGNRPEDAETMLGIRQLDHMQRCIADVLENKVPGDLLEAGVWRGGMTIFMRAALMAHRVADRKIWVVDSFAGLPEIDVTRETFAWTKGSMAASLDLVKRNFARYGLLDDQVVFLKGFFAETLPKAPVRALSILRVDADLYQSTIDVLTHLYGRLSIGGYAVFDDYQNLADCRRAIDEFRANQGIVEEIHPIDERAVYWRKLV